MKVQLLLAITALMAGCATELTDAGQNVKLVNRGPKGTLRDDQAHYVQSALGAGQAR